MTLGEWLAGVGALIGGGVASYLAGRKTAPAAERPSLTIEQRLAALEAKDAAEAAEREKRAREAARDEAAKELRALIRVAAEKKKKPTTESSDADTRKTDPPTDP